MTPMTRFAIWSATLCTVGLFAAGCYPSHGLSVEDYDTVITGYVPSTSFSAYRTYWMPDTILVDEDSRLELADEVKKYGPLILKTVAANMDALGYRRITDTLTQKPDVEVYCGMAYGSFEAYYSYWYPYWGWGYPYYPPYYGGGYGSTTINVGAIMIDMVDENAQIAGKKGGIVWGSTISGVAGGGVSNSYLSSKINQAFIQSPYLEAGGAE